MNLSTPQCSSGTTQSRPFPARAVKIMESAGHHAKGGPSRAAPGPSCTAAPGISYEVIGTLPGWRRPMTWVLHAADVPDLHAQIRQQRITIHSVTALTPLVEAYANAWEARRAVIGKRNGRLM